MMEAGRTLVCRAREKGIMGGSIVSPSNGHSYANYNSKQ